ncbi:hypothetical protein ALC57_00672 [Trachymyrmex cornetzi]|uniref:Uncharacterized protein n=1 Tax=Trachymyrmex cornetzi TaxID=471704 RepID=A0A151JR81_9HYME|nr:hypothetical protein ALC57_00672 [Trachymyrmex cornetzi]
MKEILKELKELKEMRVEMREGLKGMSKEIREVAEGQKEWMRKEMEKVKEELRVKEEKWQREKGEMLERLKVLEGELGKMKVGTGERKGEGGEEREGGKLEKGEGKEIWMERIRRLERRSEWREREREREERLPDRYVWRIQNARRRNKKERAMGGMIKGIKRELYVGEGGERGRDLQSKLEDMAEWMEGKEEGVKTVIGEDFNVRTGREGGERRSKDSKVNKEGRKLVGFIRERGWAILNGNIKGDEEGNWTYTGGRGESVIDDVLANEDAREQIECMEVGDAIELDHHSLIVAWRGGKEKGKNNGKEGRRANRGGKAGRNGMEGGEGEENMKETKERIREVLGSIEKERGKERKGRGWWDKECIEKKKRVRRKYGKYYRVEIWGWKDREEVESLQERYLRWVLGVERRTPGYLVREELQREKLRAKAGKRAWAFEERLRRGGGGSRLARLCWEEAMGNLEKGEKLEGWEREKEQYFVERGVEVDRGLRGRGRERLILRRYKKGIGKCRGWKDGKRLGIRDIIGEERWRRVAKFRLGNEVKEGRYWEEEEERKCRLCGSGCETWEHIWEGCRA